MAGMADPIDLDSFAADARRWLDDNAEEVERFKQMIFRTLQMV